MQSTSYNKYSYGFIKELVITLLAGLTIGGLTYLFIQALKLIATEQLQLNSNRPYHLLLIPFLLYFISLVKRNTLFFPSKISQLTNEKSASYWTPLMSPIHFIFTLLSHIVGLSVGREGAVVLFSAGLSRIFKLSWLFWGPIFTSIGFASAVGNYWVAPIFMFELFSKTTSVQKIYAFIGSGVSVLLMNTMGLQHLLVMPVITTELGFFQKAVGLFLLAMTAGYIMRLYKDLYFKLSTYFLKSSWLVKLSVSCILLVTLSLPEFRKFQSLGLEQLSTFNIISLSAIDVIVKLLFTLLATTLGFFGGEFIPLIYAGTHLGHHLFSFLGIDTLLGAALGAYLLFAGATRFKWTSYVMLLALLGPSWWFWGYFVLSVAITFSGNLSLYKSEH